MLESKAGIRRLEEPFRLEVVERGPVVLVRAHGELDVHSLAELEEPIRLLRPGPKRKLIIDLQGVTFIDSSAIRVLLRTEARAREEGFDFAVIPGSGQVAHVFELAGLQGAISTVAAHEPARG